MIVKRGLNSQHYGNVAVFRGGDVVLVHSNINRTLRELVRRKIRPTASLVLGSFLDAVGEAGTSSFRSSISTLRKGGTFGIENTPSQMGALTEAVRTHPGAIRTGHPIYSFAVLGEKAERFSGVANYSGYADDSLL
jgi:aminoglycoside 3-N-acetyltransferase